MFWGLWRLASSTWGAIFGGGYIAKELAKDIVSEALKKPAPPNTRFDDEAYWRDIKNPNISHKEILRKHKKGLYRTTAPKPTVPERGKIDPPRNR